jgi:hypothetical protein
MPGGGTGNASGHLTYTERHDTAALAGLFVTAGALTWTENHDTFAGVAPITHGTIAVTEGQDAAALAGWCIIVSLAYTEGQDTLSAAGGFTASGSIAGTSRADTLAGSGGFNALSSLAATGGNDTAALAGMVSGHSFLGGIGAGDVLAATGFYDPSGSIAGIGRRDTFAGFGGFSTTASMAAAERRDSLAGFSSRLEYQIYTNTGVGDPIDYLVPEATTGLLTWTSGPLTVPGIWRFGVRAFDTLTTLEEQNLDCAVTVILDASGVDITNRPKAPIGLRAFATKNASITAEWAYNTINPNPVPTGFHVYIGTGGVPDYTHPAATVRFNSSVGGTFFADLTGLVSGTAYTIGVRAFNATTEETNTTTVTVTADSVGPAAVRSLTATAIV